jgi:hypothetical protein
MCTRTYLCLDHVYFWIRSHSFVTEACFNGHGVNVQYGDLFKIIDKRVARKGLAGSGIYTFFHEKPVRAHA